MWSRWLLLATCLHQRSKWTSLFARQTRLRYQPSTLHMDRLTSRQSWPLTRTSSSQAPTSSCCWMTSRPERANGALIGCDGFTTSSPSTRATSTPSVAAKWWSLSRQSIRPRISWAPCCRDARRAFQRRTWSSFRDWSKTARRRTFLVVSAWTRARSWIWSSGATHRRRIRVVSGWT